MYQHLNPPLFYDREMKETLEDLGYEVVEEGFQFYRNVYHDGVESYTRKIYSVYYDGALVESGEGHHGQYNAVRKVFKALIRASLKHLVLNGKRVDLPGIPEPIPVVLD